MANSPIRVRIQHNSMQFSDTSSNHAHDAKAVFDHAKAKGAWIVTGTESGASHANHDLRDYVAKEAAAHGYAGYFHKFGDWVAIDKERFKKRSKGYEGPFIPGTKGINAAQGAHSPRGITWMSGETEVGTVTAGCAHYLTHGSMQASHTTNQPLVKGIKAFGNEYGKGKQICFFNADANMNDKQTDVFMGIAPFTSAADELKDWQTTHEGGAKIDIISSYDPDGRVKAKDFNVLDDSELRLYTDHYVLEAVYEVTPLTAKK